MPLRVIIIGGGIGGLTAAIALRRAGMEATVFEQAVSLQRVGAGIQLSPNATRILERLGLGEQLRAIGRRPRALVTKDWRSGQTIFAIPMGERSLEAYGAPYYHVHRADLMAMLVEAAGPDTLRLGLRCTGLAQSGGVQASFPDGTVTSGQVLIGADGIHSFIRQDTFGRDEPRFSGCVAWRGTVPIDRLEGVEAAPDATVWWGPGRHFVHYRISGGREVNFVAVVPAAQGEESWLTEGSRDELLEEFQGWHPAVRHIIEAAERHHRSALYDRAPLPRWVRGNVALLGDAAHAMLPFQAQGAAQGIEDAMALCRCLAQYLDNPGNALLLYERLRRPRASRVQRASRANGRLFHLAPPLAGARDAIFRATARFAPSALARGQDWLYGYDVDAACDEYLEKRKRTMG